MLDALFTIKIKQDNFCKPLVMDIDFKDAIIQQESYKWGVTEKCYNNNNLYSCLWVVF